MKIQGIIEDLKIFRKIKKKERKIHKTECNELQLIRERENINTQDND